MRCCSVVKQNEIFNTKCRKMNEIETVENSRPMTSSFREKTSKIYKKGDECKNIQKNIYSGLSSPGFVENGKLLLEVKVTESLCAGMSTSCPSDEIDEEDKGHVEVTIVRPRGKSSRSMNEKNVSTLSKDSEEKNEVWMVKKSSINNYRSSKLNAASIDKFLNREKSNTENYFPESEENATNKNFEPLIELGALYRILDRMKPDDSESASVWFSSEACCREILQRFQNLLREWASDRQRFDRCVASDRALVRCENCGVVRRSGESKPEENIPEIKDSEKIDQRKINSRSMRNSVKISGMEVMKNSVLDEQNKIKDKAQKFRRIPVWKRKFSSTRLNDDKREEKITMRKNSRKNEPSISRSVKNSSQNENIIEPEKNSISMETVEYLVRGNSELKDSRSKAFSDKTTILKSPIFREQKNERKQFDLHGSRDVDFHKNSNFYYLDSKFKSKENNDIFLRSLTKSGQSFDSQPSERDSEFKAVNTISSSSSAENLIRQWIKTGDVKLREKMKNKNSPEILHHGKSRKKSSNVKTVPIWSAKDRCTISKNEKPKIVDLVKNFQETSKISTIEREENFPKRKTSAELFSELDSIEIIESSTKNPKEKKNSNECSENRVPIIFFNTAESSGTEKNVTSNPRSISSSLNRQDVLVGNSEVFEREILYDEVSTDDASRESLTAVAASEALMIYRKIIESNENMDWASFEKLVTALNPSQSELWSDICTAVSNEAKRVAEETGATTEVCIEINPQTSGDKTQGAMSTRGNEITFELDMTVQDLRTILKTADRSSAHADTRNVK